MPEFVSLSCPSCGGKLEIAHDINRFACAHCGVEQLVFRSGGIISLKPVVEEIGKVRVGVDKTASELAINRLNTEIRQLIGEFKDLEEKYSEEIKQLQLERDKLTTMFSNLVIGGLIVILLSIGFISIGILSETGNSRGFLFWSVGFTISTIIILVLIFLVIKKKPKPQLKRKRFEQIQYAINAKQNEYLDAKRENAEILAKKRDELLHHQRIVEKT